MNGENGTVKGYAIGKLEKLKILKEWLTHKGSPGSFIEKCETKIICGFPENIYKYFVIRISIL